MPGSQKLTPTEVFERLQLRLEKRMEVLRRVKLEGYGMVISESGGGTGSPAPGTTLFGGVISGDTEQNFIPPWLMDGRWLVGCTTEVSARNNLL